MPAGIRRGGRAYALQVLYALDVGGETDGLAAVGDYARTFELSVDDRSVEFAAELVAAASANREAIDDAIQRASRNWRLERMARVDRNILRLATCELTTSDSVPIKVVINEAVELAKRFSAAESPAFINGILDRVAQSARRRS